MLKKVIAPLMIILIFAHFGCGAAGLGSAQKVNQLSLGMSQEEVIKILDSKTGPSTQTLKPFPMHHCPQIPTAHFIYLSNDA